MLKYQVSKGLWHEILNELVTYVSSTNLVVRKTKKEWMYP